MGEELRDGEKPKRKRGPRTGEAKRRMMEKRKLNRLFREEVGSQLEQVVVDYKFGEKHKYTASYYKVETSKGIKGAYIIGAGVKEISDRHKLIAELASCGMNPTQIRRAVSDSKCKTYGYYHRLLRDPRMTQMVGKKLEDIAQEARELLKKAVVQAAQNYVDAVERGDMKASEKVLEHSRVFNNVDTKINVTMSFGDWLKSADKDSKSLEHFAGNTIEVETIVDDEEPVPVKLLEPEDNTPEGAPFFTAIVEEENPPPEDVPKCFLSDDCFLSEAPSDE